MLVICIYKFDFSGEALPKYISTLLSQLGIVTYGVYLLHPIIDMYFSYAARYLNIYNSYYLIAMVMIATIAISFVSFYLFEEKFIKLGKRITKK